MAANSFARRLAKRVLAPFLNETTYGLFQAVATAWDIRTGGWTEDELPLLPSMVSPGDVVLDVGANYGQYAYHLSRLVGPSGRVYSFEPLPFTASTFRRITRVLGLKNVSLVEAGAGDAPGEVVFNLPLQGSGAAAAGQAHVGTRNDDRPGRDRHHQYPRTRPVRCRIVRIDDEVPASARVSFIKADVEGAELAAFRGAAATIERCHPTVLCEINTWFLEGFGIKLQELAEFFSSRHYEAFWYDASAGRLRRAQLEGEIEDNFVFVHPSRLSSVERLIDRQGAPTAGASARARA